MLNANQILQGRAESCVVVAAIAAAVAAAAAEITTLAVVILAEASRNHQVVTHRLAQATATMAAHQGIFAGYHVRLNHEALGLTLRAVVRVNLNSHSQQNETDFISLVSHHDEITEAFSVSGDADYVLIMQCRDLASFSEFIHHILLPKPMIGQVKSEIALRQIKQPY